MSLNYFTIMSGADKEMMHSAMLKFLLGYDDFFRKELFPECPSPIIAAAEDGGPATSRIRLEAPYPGRKRIDVEAHSADGKYVLIIENKFKAFPTIGQLQEYDGLYGLEKREKISRTRGKTMVSYLVCFAGESVTFSSRDKRVSTSSNTFWHIRTYKEIRDAIAAYLQSRGETLPPDVRYFLEHYVAYLDDYSAAYAAVRDNYSLAFAAEGLSDDELLPAGLPEKLRDTRFWKRLALSAVGNAFAGSRAECGLEDFEPGYNNGNTQEPFLDIIPPSGTSWYTTGTPRLFVQVQGREIKLFTHRLDAVKESGAARDAFLNHCVAVQNNMEDKPGKKGTPNSSGAMLRHIKGKSASFKIYTEKLDIDVPVAALVGQLQDFVLRMDAAVNKTGPFLLP